MTGLGIHSDNDRQLIEDDRSDFEKDSIRQTILGGQRNNLASQLPEALFISVVMDYSECRINIGPRQNGQLALVDGGTFLSRDGQHIVK